MILFLLRISCRMAIAIVSSMDLFPVEAWEKQRYNGLPSIDIGTPSALAIDPRRSHLRKCSPPSSSIPLASRCRCSTPGYLTSRPRTGCQSRRHLKRCECTALASLQSTNGASHLRPLPYPGTPRRVVSDQLRRRDRGCGLHVRSHLRSGDGKCQ